MERHESDLRGMRGSCLVGTLLAVMGALNLLNTVSTLRSKRRRAVARARASPAQPKAASAPAKAAPKQPAGKQEKSA